MSIKSNGGRGALPDHVGISSGYAPGLPGRESEKEPEAAVKPDEVEDDLVDRLRAAGFRIEEDHGDRLGITGARKF